MNRRTILLLLACAVPCGAARADLLAQDLQPMIASPTAAGDAFGAAAAVWGTTAVVGAPGRDLAGAQDAGAAYVYALDDETWTEVAILTASTPGPLDELGRSVDVSNQTIVVGSPNDATTAGRTGSVCVFVRSGSTWVEEAQLTAADGSIGDRFGEAVAIWGDTLLVGAPGRFESGAQAGAVYVFVRSGTSWVQTTKLVGTSGAPALDRFGAALDVRGDRAAIGAPGSDAGGFVYVYHRAQGGGWSLVRRLQAAASCGGLGRAPAMTDERIVAGADNAGFYTTRRAGADWQPLELTQGPGPGGDGLGSAVAIDGERVYVGAATSAAVHAYATSGTGWCYVGDVQRVTGPGARFGASVAAADGRVVVGADLAGPLDEGIAFFVRPVEALPRTAPGATLVPSDGMASDGFGDALAVDGDTAAVASPRHDLPPRNSAGAVYVHRRTGAGWTEVAKLTAPPLSGLSFGRSVDVDGGTIAVSGWQNTSVFTGSGTSWTEEAFLAGEMGAVGLSGDTLVVGTSVFERTGTVWNGTGTLQASGSGTLSGASRSRSRATPW